MNGRKMIVVDDQLGIRLLLYELFKGEGFDIRLASSGLEALEILEDFKPNVGIFDVRMRGLNGLKTLRKFKEICPDIKPVIISAGEEEEIYEEASRLGAMVVAKPFDVFYIRELINSICA